MLAAVISAPGAIRCEEVPVPSLGADDQVLVEVLVAGCCGSDVHAVRNGPCGRPPGAPGHESVGRVVDSSSDAWRVGDRALVVPPAAQAAAFAELQLVTASQLIRLDADDDAEVAVLAQQLGTVIHALDRFWPTEAPRHVVVTGAGPAGLLMVHALRARGGVPVVVSDPLDWRRAAALTAGAQAAVTPQELTTAVADLTTGEGADMVIEAAGTDAARSAALSAVRPGGHLGFFGLPESSRSTIAFDRLFRAQVHVTSSHGAQKVPGLGAFRSALARTRSDAVWLRSLVTDRLPLADVPEAMSRLTAPRAPTLKVLITR